MLIINELFFSIINNFIERVSKKERKRKEESYEKLKKIEIELQRRIEYDKRRSKCLLCFAFIEFENAENHLDICLLVQCTTWIGC